MGDHSHPFQSRFNFYMSESIIYIELTNQCMVRMEKHESGEPLEDRGWLDEIKEHVLAYIVIFFLLILGAILYINSIVHEMEFSFCCVPAIMSLVVILAGFVMKRNEELVGLAIMILGFIMGFLSFLGIIYFIFSISYSLGV